MNLLYKYYLRTAFSSLSNPKWPTESWLACHSTSAVFDFELTHSMGGLDHLLPVHWQKSGCFDSEWSKLPTEDSYFVLWNNNSYLQTNIWIFFFLLKPSSSSVSLLWLLHSNVLSFHWAKTKSLCHLSRNYVSKSNWASPWEHCPADSVAEVLFVWVKA